MLASVRIPDTYQFLDKCDFLFLSSDIDKGDSRDGLAYSKLLDSFSEYLSDKGYVCQHLSHGFTSFARQETWSNSASANQKFLWLFVRAKALVILSKVLRIPIHEAEPWINADIEKFYRELFELTQSKCVIAIGSTPPICRAARSRGIPIIELLHGIGYATVPWGWDKLPTCNLPSGILSLDDVSTRTFGLLSTQGIEVKQIPHPFFRLFFSEENRTKLPLEWQRKPTYLPDDKITVLFSLAWGYDGDHGIYSQFAGILENGLIPDAVLEAIERTRDSVFWLLRLHPVQLRKARYNHHRKFLEHLTDKYPNCEWYQSSILPLPLLLSHCNGHMTMSSMTAYDAAFMAVKSLMLCPTLQSGGASSTCFRDLIQAGFAELGSFDVDQILKWVTSIRRSSYGFATSHNSDTDLDPAIIEWMLTQVDKTELQVSR
jgi:hypothetical protein